MSPRADAAVRIREAVARLLVAADLDDLAAFITATRLAREAGVSPSTLQALHPPGTTANGGVRTSAQTAVRSAVRDPSFDGGAVHAAVEALVVEALGAAEEDGDPPGMPEVLAGLADLAVEAAVGELADLYTQDFLMALVARDDDELRTAAASELHSFLAAHTTLARRLCEMTGREPVEGVSYRDLAVSAMLAFDGAVLNVRLDPELGAEAVQRLLLAVWTGLTRRVGDVDD
ncbi:MAG: hypothetical protein ACOYOP_16665, partial [Microthrixaceae bacterium]